MANRKPLSVAHRTCIFDSARLFFAGSIDSVLLSVCLLIAIRLFHAPVAAKGLLSSLVWFGGLTAPFIVRVAAASGWRASRFGALLFLFTAAAFAAAACARSIGPYIICIALAGVFYRADAAIMAKVYAENYGHGRMASLMAPGLILAALMTVAFGQFSGVAMDRSIGNSGSILVATAICGVICAVAAMAIPSHPIRGADGVVKESYMKYFFRNRALTKMAIYLTAVGLAYQMLIPMRVEHLTNCVHGWNLSNFHVLLLSLAVPNFARLLSTPLLAFMFDHMRLIPVRQLTNIVFLGGILFYFNGNSFTAIAIGGALLGVAMAGSFVMHSLWLTKVVPPQDLPKCMSVYLMLTGLRSIIAPLASYALLAIGSPRTAAYGATLLLIFAIIGFWTLRRDPAIR
ncbi:MAG: MFS transporter [Puniceicoccales bacterium]|jgi:hypothetical protein|nr:MFS transporter [Puniceicoccales bacterium]